MNESNLSSARRAGIFLRAPGAHGSVAGVGWRSCSAGRALSAMRYDWSNPVQAAET